MKIHPSKLTQISTIFIFSIFLFLSNIFANTLSDSSKAAETLFYKNKLIPTPLSSYNQKLPNKLSFCSDNFYDEPNTLFFVIIHGLSNKLTKDLKKYVNKKNNVDIKIYSLIDTLKSEIFPYAEKYDSRGIVLFCEDKLVGISCINKDFMFSVDGKNFLAATIIEENLENFLTANNSITITERDLFLKTLPQEEIVKEMIKNFNAKNMNNFYSCFSTKYKFSLLFTNFINKNNFDIDVKQTFLGNSDDITSVELKSIKSMMPERALITDFITTFEAIFLIKNKNNEQIEKIFLISFNYSKKFGYRVCEVR